MMTDGGKDPQSNQNSDAPFQTGAQDNEAPPGTPACLWLSAMWLRRLLWSDGGTLALALETKGRGS